MQCLRTSPFSLCTVVNADRTVHQGVEAGFGVAFLKSTFQQDDRFWFNLAYTYNDFFFDGDARWGNNQLPGVPPHTIRAEVLYKHPSGFYAGPNVEWMPKSYFADNAINDQKGAVLNDAEGLHLRPLPRTRRSPKRNKLPRAAHQYDTRPPSRLCKNLDPSGQEKKSPAPSSAKPHWPHSLTIRDGYKMDEPGIVPSLPVAPLA